MEFGDYPWTELASVKSQLAHTLSAISLNNAELAIHEKMVKVTVLFICKVPIACRHSRDIRK